MKQHNGCPAGNPRQSVCRVSGEGADDTRQRCDQCELGAMPYTCSHAHHVRCAFWGNNTRVLNESGLRHDSLEELLELLVLELLELDEEEEVELVAGESPSGAAAAPPSAGATSPTIAKLEDADAAPEAPPRKRFRHGASACESSASSACPASAAPKASMNSSERSSFREGGSGMELALISSTDSGIGQSNICRALSAPW